MPSVAFLTACISVAAAATAQLPVTSPNAGLSKDSPLSADRCPLTIFIDGQGHLYDSRFYGHYRVSEQTLRNDVGGGCKESGPTSSVRIQPSPKTKFGRVQEVMGMVQSIRPDVPVTLLTPRQQP